MTFLVILNYGQLDIAVSFITANAVRYKLQQ